jgi:hypothetical protein
MRDREVFRWAFAISGLWLILSPFLFLGGASSFGTDVIGEAATFVIMGLMALVTTCFSFSKYDKAYAYSGLVLGLFFVAVPPFAGFTETIAIWNAGLVGMFLAFVAFWEVIHRTPEPVATLPLCGAQDAPHAFNLKLSAPFGQIGPSEATQFHTHNVYIEACNQRVFR